MLQRIRENADGEGCAPIYTPDGKHIIDGSMDGFINVWDAETAECACSEEHSDRMVQGIVYCPANETYAVGLWTKVGHRDGDTESGLVLLGTWPFAADKWRKLPKRWDNLWAVQWSPDGSMLAVIHGERYMSNVVDVVDAETGDVRSTFAIDEGRQRLDWSPDGTFIARTDYHEVVLLSAPDLRKLRVIEQEYTADVRFSPDGTLLAIGANREGLVLPVAELGV